MLKEMQGLFNNIKEFDSTTINRDISHLIFNRYEVDKNMNNTNFYAFLKLILTGDSEMPNIGAVCEFLGKKEILSRIKKANNISKEHIVENLRLYEEKKDNHVKLIANSLVSLAI